MGDRACLLFFDDRVISPTVYLHWHGEDIPDWLQLLTTRMRGRSGDAFYATARFIGICHERIEGNLSLGVRSNSFTHADLQRPEILEAASPGDSGLVVVDTRDFSWRVYGGDLDTPLGSEP
ncbi:MAG: hypothetical protein ACRC8S_14920 [Fimbriiglobus sp.]